MLISFHPIVDWQYDLLGFLNSNMIFRWDNIGELVIVPSKNKQTTPSDIDII